MKHETSGLHALELHTKHNMMSRKARMLSNTSWTGALPSLCYCPQNRSFQVAQQHILTRIACATYTASDGQATPRYLNARLNGGLRIKVVTQHTTIPLVQKDSAHERVFMAGFDTTKFDHTTKSRCDQFDMARLSKRDGNHFWDLCHHCPNEGVLTANWRSRMQPYGETGK